MRLGFGVIEMLMMLALPMGGGNDLLDFVPTDEFWRSQKVFVSGRAMLSELRVVAAPDISESIKQLSSDDFSSREKATREILLLGPAVVPQLEAAVKTGGAETALRARSLIKTLGGSKKTSATRKLIAIRTLGELRHRQALGPLDKLLKSEQPFVADYAGRAIARIEGKPYHRQRPSRAELDEDVWILPAKCAAVGQVSLIRPVPLSLKKALEKVTPRRRGVEVKPADMLKRVNAMIIATANSLGNVRLDALTMGVSGDIGNRTGFVVIVARGQYDRKAFVAAIRQMAAKAGPIRGRFSVSQVDGVDVISLFGEFQVLLVSDQRMILVGGPRAAVLPVKEMIAAAKAKKGTLHENKKLAQLIKSVDRNNSSLWAAMVPTENYKKFPLFAPFDSMTLTARQHADGSVTGKLVAHGADSDARRAAVALFYEHKEHGTREIREEVERMPMVLPIVAFLQSIKHSQDEKSVTVTAKIDDPGPMLMMPLMMAASFGFRF